MPLELQSTFLGHLSIGALSVLLIGIPLLPLSLLAVRPEWFLKAVTAAKFNPPAAFSTRMVVRVFSCVVFSGFIVLSVAQGTRFDRIDIRNNVVELAYPFEIGTMHSLPVGEVAEIRIGQAPNRAFDPEIVAVEVLLRNNTEYDSYGYVNAGTLHAVEDQWQQLSVVSCRFTYNSGNTSPGIFEYNKSITVFAFDANMCA